jgi:hypothetical protein
MKTEKRSTEKPSAVWIAAAVMALVSFGCNRSEGVAVYPVSGKLTFEGKPLAGGGSIAFVAPSGQVGKTAGGEIKPDGTYSLTTYKEGDGSMPGEFRVIVMQTTVKEPEASQDGQPAPPGPISVVPDSDRIPEIYADHLKSPLTARVEAKPANEVDLDLKRQ